MSSRLRWQGWCVFLLFACTWFMLHAEWWWFVGSVGVLMLTLLAGGDEL